MEAALEKVYAAAGKIRFEGMHYRKDIGRHSNAVQGQEGESPRQSSAVGD